MPEIDETCCFEPISADSSTLRSLNLASSDSIDLRIFFTMAHGYITRRVFQCAKLFTNPNSLMHLNECFATRISQGNQWQAASRFGGGQVSRL